MSDELTPTQNKIIKVLEKADFVYDKVISLCGCSNHAEAILRRTVSDFEELEYKSISSKLLCTNNAKANLLVHEIELIFEMAILLSMVDKKPTKDELHIAKDKVAEFLELSPGLNKSEINFIFTQALGNELEQEKFFEISFMDIQIACFKLFLKIENIKVNYLLISLLDELTKPDELTTNNQLIFYNIFTGLVASKENYELYQPILDKVDKHWSDYMYSNQGIDPKAFRKKLPKALNSYAKGIDPKYVIALYDATLFGKSDEGFIITTYGIVSTMDDIFNVIPFGSVFSVEYDSEGMTFYSKLDVQAGKPFAGFIPRSGNLRVLSNILAQIADINNALSLKEEVAS